MFSVVKEALEILMLRGNLVRASAQNGRGTYTLDEAHEASYRALLRDVILGSIAVIVFSLAVPVWIIRVEYSKTYGRVPRPRSVAEVLRERTVEGLAATPRRPTVLELAEQIVRREAQRRESERGGAEEREIARREAYHRNAPDSPVTTNTDVYVDHAAARPPAEAVPPAANSSQVDLRESVQAP
jgi:hypothetical protein